MRVMITGASGFVGSHTVAALVSAGHRPRALVRDHGRATRALAAVGVAAGDVELVPGDMLDSAAVTSALDGCDAAIHAAAVIDIIGGTDADVLETNVSGTRNVVGGAVARGLDPVVHLSSVGVFVPPDRPVITADAPLARPRTGYGQSKVEAERYVRDLQDSGAPVVIVYPGGVCGPHQPVLDTLNEGIVAGLRRMWPCPPGGVTVLDVRDLAEAIRRCLEPGQGARRWLLGGHYLTWPQLADLCAEVTGRASRRIGVPASVLLGLGSALDAVKKVRPVDFPLTRDVAEMMTTLVPTDDQPLLGALGLTLRAPAETLADTIHWLAAAGHLAPSRAGRAAGPAGRALSSAV